MPNRGEIPTPAGRTKSAVHPGARTSDAEGWTIVAFCTVGWLMTLYFALATVGTDSFPKLLAQVPWG